MLHEGSTILFGLDENQFFGGRSGPPFSTIGLDRILQAYMAVCNLFHG